MNILLNGWLSLILLSISTYTAAQIPISGSFIARSECPVSTSVRKRAHSDNIKTKRNKVYRLVAKNKEHATHYLIRIGAQSRLKWVSINCGEITTSSNSHSSLTNQSGSASAEHYILAVSWQPGFCETRPLKPECQSQTESRFDASNFTLHGLWPQPRSNIYCHVAADIVAEDSMHNWHNLPALALNDATRQQLNRIMPGTQSLLHRHEWFKHGTCYNGKTEEEYYKDSINLLNQLNNSNVRDLFKNNVGETITATQIRAAFDNAFGPGAGDKIKIACKNDGSRRLITELTIALKGNIVDAALRESIQMAPDTHNIGCTQGVVDPVGLQ